MKLPLKPSDAKKPVLNMPQILEGRASTILSTGEGLALLERHLLAAFPQEEIKNLIYDLCHAEDVRLTKEGPMKIPNWNARKDGLDRVLKLLRYTQATDKPGERTPTKVIFNTVVMSANSKLPKHEKPLNRGHD